MFHLAAQAPVLTLALAWQEIIEKAPQMPADIEWRFIGKLQSNKAKALVQGVPSLQVVETLDSLKLADRLQKASAESGRTDPLGVMIQVNTSPWEGTKSGLLPAEVLPLATHLATSCPHLRLVGLMTIGAPGEASCFQTLADCRDGLAAELSLTTTSLELSMGMSNDFEAAIAHGSDSVRVGSSIFGARAYPPKA
jgi:PLP dependent protein